MTTVYCRKRLTADYTYLW